MQHVNSFALCKAAWLPMNIIFPIQYSTLWRIIAKVVIMLLLCGQTVSISAQCPILCHGSITIALDSSGTSTLTPEMMVQSPISSCNGSFEIEVKDTAGNIYSSELTGNLVGKILTATITHLNSGNNCSSDLSVVDNLPPTIECQEIFAFCNVPHDSLTPPIIYDNISPFDSLTISLSDNFIDYDCFSIHGDSTTIITGLLERTWTVIDESGNSQICVQKVWIKRATLDMISFPENFDGFDNPPLECGADDPNDLNFTGQPTINNYLLTNASDCELITSYSDQEIPACGGAVKLLRTWSVFDLCTEEVRIFVQVIRINDHTPPEIICPESVSFSTYTNTCLAQVWLPAAIATDECSNVTLTPSWEFGTGQGPYNNVIPGEYQVTYLAEDECGNQNSCTIIVLIEDDDPPTAICENQIAITLQSDGSALIYAETFDDGSHDNCELTSYKVSRDGDPFDEFVYFDCGDVGNPVSVIMKISDANGLENQCISTVNVVDDVNPEALCPPTSELDCGTNYTNPDLTGQPFATDNCAIENITFLDEINLNTCGIGTVLRLWVVSDVSGNTASCTQTIHINDNTPLSISFPEDIITYECGANTAPSITGEPVITGSDCEQLGIDYADFFFYTAYPACYQLVRKWAVIDFCSFEPNSGAGFWEYTQIIEVFDNEAPDITCPDDFTAGIDNGGCEMFVQVPIPLTQDCSEEITLHNNSPYAFFGNEDASGIYPIGTHTITFFASDGCGNTSQCSMILTVEDAETPSPVCNNGVSVTIQQSGFVTVTPGMIENGSSDNCSDYQSLVMQLSPNTFSCQEVGNQTVTLTVTDEFGNSAFCQTTVVVQDNFDLCEDETSVTIAGKLGTASGEPLSQKLVGLAGSVSIAMHTNVDGTYAFQNLPTNSSYTITPTYDTEYLNGVTTFDLVIMRRHILGIELLDSPYKWVAADINQSGTVTTIDMVELRKMILNVQEGFTNNTSWRFIPSNYVFQNPENPLNEAFSEMVFIENLTKNEWAKDFIGIKIGDINDSADPGGFNGESEDRSALNKLILNIENIELEKDLEYSIPIQTTDFQEILGFQFALNFDVTALEFIGIELSDLERFDENNFGKTLLHKGVLTTSWENALAQNPPPNPTLFSLKFRANKNGFLHEYLSLTNQYTPAEAYAGNYTTTHTNFELLNVALEFSSISTEELELFQNTPNPFNNDTQIHFQLPKSTEATLKIYDLSGRVLWQTSGLFEEGVHEIEVNFTDFKVGQGIYLLELSAPDFQPQMKKLIKID